MSRAVLMSLQCQLAIPALMIPLWLGVYLLRRPALFHKFVGMLTIKPAIATPVYVALLLIGTLLTQASRYPYGGYIAMLPGLLLTLLIIRRFKEFFSGRWRSFALLLQGLDVLRMGTALAFIYFLGDVLCVGRGCAGQTAEWPGVVVLTIALVFPTLYALAAFLIYRKTRGIEAAQSESAERLAGSENSGQV